MQVHGPAHCTQHGPSHRTSQRALDAQVMTLPPPTWKVQLAWAVQVACAAPERWKSQLDVSVQAAAPVTAVPAQVSS